MQLARTRSGWAKEIQMLMTNHKFSRLGLSFAAALLLSSAGGSVAHANPLPTSSDEARLAGKVMTSRATAVAAPIIGVVSSTDEARALAGRSLPISSINATASTIVTSTDDARAVAGNVPPVPSEIERPEGSHAVASTAERN
jgi:hypothetical protein